MAVKLASILLLWRTVAITWAVKISSETEQHIANCIDVYEANATGLLLGTTLQAPVSFAKSETNEFQFLLPKLLIWDPLKRFPLSCPVHKVELKASFWLSKQQTWRQPRLLYDINGNTLLVARYYACSHMRQCRWLSIDDQIMRQLPRDQMVPFLLCHRSGCTRTLLEYMCTCIGHGLSFIEITSLIQQSNHRSFSQRVHSMTQHGLNLPENQLRECVIKLLSDFSNNEIFTVPSSGLSEAMFLQNFKLQRQHFQTSMRRMSAQRLTIVFLPFDWSKQYKNLALIVNEKRQVISWVLCHGTTFKEIEPVFSGLSSRLRRQGSYVHSIVVDHCCQWRTQLQNLFSTSSEQDTSNDKPNASSLPRDKLCYRGHSKEVHNNNGDTSNHYSVDVFRDIAYSVQQVTQHAPRKGRLVHDRLALERDLMRIFRAEDDMGEIRYKPTVTPRVVANNLGNLIKRWQTIGDDKLLNPEVVSQLELLRAHVEQGCLSNIPCGLGRASIQELLDILQKPLLCNTKNLGPEVLFALLTVILHYWNKSLENDSSVSLTLESEHGENSKSKYCTKTAVNDEQNKCNPSRNHFDLSNFFPDASNEENEFFGFALHDSHNLQCFRQITRLEDLLTTQARSRLISVALDMQEIVETIRQLTLAKEGSPVGFQLAHVGYGCLLNSNSSTSSNKDNNIIARDLDYNLQSFNLIRVPIAPNGDCLFSSVLHQLDNINARDEIVDHSITTHNSDNRGNSLGRTQPKLNDFFAHIRGLGLYDNFIDPSDRVQQLRELTVQDLLARRDDILPLCVGLSSPGQYEAEVLRFRQPGIFGGQMGDLIIRTIASVICCPIVVITAHSSIPMVPFIPEKALLKMPIFVAYNHYGPGHYDSTQVVSRELESAKEQPVKPASELGQRVQCRCGANKSKHKAPRVFCSNIAGSDETTRYKTRCQCHKSQRSCVDCQCQDCANEYNPASVLCAAHRLLRCRRCKRLPCNTTNTTSTERQNRKRTVNGEVVTSDDSGSAVSEWSLLECCLLEAVISVLTESMLPLTTGNIEQLYKFVCEEPANVALGLAMKAKSSGTIEAKITARKTGLQASLHSAEIPFQTPVSVTTKPLTNSYTEAPVNTGEISTCTSINTGLADPVYCNTNNVLPSIFHSAFTQDYINYQGQPTDILDYTAQNSLLPSILQTYPMCSANSPAQVMNLTQCTPIRTTLPSLHECMTTFQTLPTVSLSVGVPQNTVHNLSNDTVRHDAPKQYHSL